VSFWDSDASQDERTNQPENLLQLFAVSIAISIVHPLAAAIKERAEA
jgi:hypothetical protein